VSVYLTEREAQQLDIRRGGIGRGRWFRQAGLGVLSQPVPSINRQAWAELARVSANLNQYQKAINEGRAGGPISLDELRSIVDALRNDLIGVHRESED
jgi:hypothetical protein